MKQKETNLKTSFGHHQRDKDEKGLSPQPQQESKEESNRRNETS